MFKSSLIAVAVIQLLVVQSSFSASPPAKAGPGTQVGRPAGPVLGKPIVAPASPGREVMDGTARPSLTEVVEGAISNKQAMDHFEAISPETEGWSDDAKATLASFIGQVQARPSLKKTDVIQAGGKSIKMEDFINCK